MTDIVIIISLIYLLLVVCQRKEGFMKKIFTLIFCVLVLFTYLESAYVGKIYFRSRTSVEPIKFFKPQSANPAAFFSSEIQKGNLRLLKIQKDPTASMEHHRYQQFYKGLEVFGGQIIEHRRNGNITGINGEYYQIYDINTVPVITKDEAVEFFIYDLNKEDLVEKGEESKLFIYPVKDGDYRLAYKIIMEKGIGYSMTGIIDAETGKVLLKYSNICFDELTIGLGTGYHGGQYKLPTTYYDGFYYLYDEKNVRPVNQYTIDWNLGGDFFGYDDDNYWDYDAVLVNAHAFLGLTYDYYYMVHGREGMDDYNLDIVANVHWPIGNDNAFWNGSINQMFFLDPGLQNSQTAAALDVVAHEYSHGVTTFTSDLIYSFESGALNESFSDIMGTAVEHYCQSEGSGLLKADWYIGEDMGPTYSTGWRNLEDPNSISSIFGPYPCHLSQFYILPYTEDGDWGGVHINSTIYSHAYYLLAHGGTNLVSGITVNGIGIDKATNIFYRAWTYYMIRVSDFLYAANALLQSADDLYGSSSNEYAQTIRSMEAIGWIYGSSPSDNVESQQPKNGGFAKKENDSKKDVAPSQILSNRKKIKVIVERATIHLDPRVTSTIIETVKRGTVLNLYGSTRVNRNWYNVIFVTEKKITKSGYIQVSFVEITDLPPKFIKEEKKELPEKEKVVKVPEIKKIEKKKPLSVLKKKRKRAASLSREKVQKDNKIFIKLHYTMGFSENTKSVSWLEEIYFEDASYGINNDFNKGNSFNVSLGYKFSSSIGIELGMDLCSRNILSDYSASIPHPLLFNSPRDAEKEGSYKLTENAVYLNFVYSIPFSKFGLDIFGGPAYFLSKIELIKEIQYSDSYPYETISISANTEEVKKNSFGFNAGASLNYYIAKGFGVFINAQYFSSSVDFESSTDILGLKLSLGGFKAGVGLSILF